MLRRLILILIAALLPISAVEACGIPVPQGGDMGMAKEQGVIIWDGQVERVLMELSITGDADEAAWIFPSPTPATAELGDSKLLDELEELTKPLVVVEHRPTSDGLVGGAPPEGGVTVLSQQRLGPFEVASLAATDSVALQQWLADNGYSFPPELGPLMQPYIDDEWYFTALRTVPEGADKLVGRLDPIWLTFETTEMVYTMRPAAMAAEPFPSNIYVFADHRVQKSANFGDSQITFADFVDPTDLPADSMLKPLLSRKMFLTKFRETIEPALVSGDFFFAFSANDDPFHETQTQIMYDATPSPLDIFIPSDNSSTPPFAWVFLACVCCGGLGLILGATFLVIRRKPKI